MSEGKKKLPATSHGPDRVIYLWSDLSEAERTNLIEQTRLKLEARKERARLEAERLQEVDIEPPPLEGEPARVRKASPHAGKYLPNEYPDDLAEAWEEMCGLNLDDGWLRLACLHKLYGLCFFIRERYADAWLGFSFSKKVKTTKGMKVWPRRAASKANPFKWASIYEVQIVRFEWHEDLEQYKVVLEFEGEGMDTRRHKVVKSKVQQTYWFKAEFADVPMGEGWVRPVQTSQFNPL